MEVAKKPIKTIGLSSIFAFLILAVVLFSLIFGISIFREFALGSFLMWGVAVLYFLPFSRVRIFVFDDRLTAVLFSRSLEPKKRTIRYSEIKEILINRLTPFYKENLSEKKITWRERVIIDKDFGLPGFFYSNLEDLLAQIKKANPKVKIRTYNNTVGDNLRENASYNTKRTILELLKPK